jgi:CRISPR-associated protein Cas2
MWLMVMFDLPVLTKENRRDYRRFVDKLEDDGYARLQFSIYVRPCVTDENTAAHAARVLEWLPPAGEVRVLKFTDKQWGRMTVYREAFRVDTESAPEQFLFFDEDLAPLVGELDSAEVDHRLQVWAAEADPPPELPAGEVTERFIATRSRDSGSFDVKRGGRPKRRRKGRPDDNPSFDFYE